MVGGTRPPVRIVMLDEHPELLDATRVAIREFLLLPDSWVESVAPEGELPDFLVEELSRLPFDPAPPSGRVALALVGDETAGTAQIRPMEGEICELKRVYVREAFRRKEVGRALVERLIAEARSQGYRSIYLDTTINRPGSAFFYESLGFRHTESRHDWGDSMLSFVREIDQ